VNRTWYSPLVVIPEPAQTYQWWATTQGRLLLVREKWNWRKSPQTEKRGSIGGFSNASRLRMLKTIAIIDWSKVGPSLLITLTYPGELGKRRYSERVKDLYLFHRYMEKHLGKEVALLWRTEWKVRKSGQQKGQLLPHVHLVVFDVRWIPWQAVRGWWRTILGHEGPLATDVGRAGDGDTAARYAAKYAAKPAEEGSLDSAAYLNNSIGRAWGVKRRRLIPFCDKDSFRLGEKLARQLRQLAATIFEGYDVERGEGFTLFGDIAVMVGKDLMKKGIDGCLEDA
jgi:hypothetical protein